MKRITKGRANAANLVRGYRTQKLDLPHRSWRKGKCDGLCWEGMSRGCDISETSHRNWIRADAV
jgi:hypothetical protein